MTYLYPNCRWKKCVCIFAVVSSLVFIVATGLLAYQVSQANQEIRKMEFKLNGTRKVLEQLNRTSPICMTSECITSAAQLIESLDETADPCDDFYQFACGGWMENHPIPPRLSSWSQFGLLNHRVSTFIEGSYRTKFIQKFILNSIIEQKSLKARTTSTIPKPSTAPGTCSRPVSISAGSMSWVWILWLNY